MTAATYHVTGLTCEQADWHQMGEQSVQMLLRHLDNSKLTPEHVLVPFTLREGSTTAEPGE